MNKHTNLVTHNLKTRAFKKYLKSIFLYPYTKPLPILL